VVSTESLLGVLMANTKNIVSYCDCGRRGKKRTLKLGRMVDAEPDGSRVVDRVMCDDCAKSIGMFGARFVSVIR